MPAFLRPAPLATVALTNKEMSRLEGVYELDFDSTVPSTVTVHDGRIQLFSPDVETIDLVAHSPTFFTAVSQYGPLTVMFKESEREIIGLTVYGVFSRFLFEKR